MPWKFVVSDIDPLAEKVYTKLVKLGREVRKIDPNRDFAYSDEVALFSVGVKLGRGRFTRTASYRIPKELIPEWAKPTPFVVALHQNTQLNSRHTIESAVESLVYNYEMWIPNFESPPSGSAPTHDGSYRKEYDEWISRAIAQTSTNLADVLKGFGVSTLYGNSPEHWENQSLLLMGCVHLNPKRTDVMEALDPVKSERVVQSLQSLINMLIAKQNVINQITFALADELMLKNTTLKASLNPLMSADLSQMEDLRDTRRSGDANHQSDEQMSLALALNASITQEQITFPLGDRVSVPVNKSSWLDILDPYMEEAEELAVKFEGLGNEIYARRAQSYESYNRIHTKLGAAAGLERARANMVIYLATALLAHTQRDCTIIEYEYDDQWMTELRPPLEHIWGDKPPLYLALPKRLRQPWAY
jgi:hypothetical protein